MSVTLRQEGLTIATTTTGTDGNYNFVSVAPGMKSVMITPGSGTTCTPGHQQVVTVTASQTTIANFACTHLPGEVNGTVTVNGVGEAGIVVSVTGESAVTNSEGFYSILFVSSGPHPVFVQAPSEVTCPDDLHVTVPVAGTVTLNIACTRPL